MTFTSFESGLGFPGDAFAVVGVEALLAAVLADPGVDGAADGVAGSGAEGEEGRARLAAES
eukprot:7401873-Alexandrium_andersonii.AAC.2